KILAVGTQGEVRGLAVEGVGESGCFRAAVCCARGNRCGRPPGANGRLVEINNARKFHSMVAHVGDIETKLSGKSMLDAHSPVDHIRSAEIAIHGEAVARTWIASDSVSALNSSRYAGGINRSRLVLPGDANRVAGAGWEERDPRRERGSVGWCSGRRNRAVTTHWSHWTGCDRGHSGNGAKDNKSGV